MPTSLATSYVFAGALLLMLASLRQGREGYTKWFATAGPGSLGTSP